LLKDPFIDETAVFIDIGMTPPQHIRDIFAEDAESRLLSRAYAITTNTRNDVNDAVTRTYKFGTELFKDPMPTSQTSDELGYDKDSER